MLRFAIRNLMSRPVRSVLALLGLTVAIAGMVGLFSVAAGLSLLVDKAFGRTAGLVAMQEGALIPIFSRLPTSWADEVSAMPDVHVARPEVWSRIQVLDGKVVFNPPRLLFGANVADTLKLKRAVFRDDVVEGRFLREEDRGTYHCLVSRQISKDLRKGVGDTIRIDGYDAEIVGVYESGSILLDMAILMHDEDVRKIAKFSDEVMSSMYIEPKEGVPPQRLIAEIRRHFRGRQGEGGGSASLPRTGNPLADLASDLVQSLQSQAAAETSPSEEGEIQEGIEVRTAKDWGARLLEFNADLDIVLWLMTLIGVAVALLSILNTMLMSVSERLVEFGVLKANGWTPANILTLILLESTALGVCGGVLGCAAGWLGTLVLNAVYETRMNLYASPGVLGFSLAFSVVLGAAGGLYPAWWAVRMSPMDAIRRG